MKDILSPTIGRSPPLAGEGAPPGSGAMFDRLAGRYDVINLLLSGGMDRRWRNSLVASLHPRAGMHLLDVATGTADVALAIAAACPDVRVTGVDVSAQMMAVAQAKTRRAGCSDRVDFTVADAQSLPFSDAQFDGACISFGIRNVGDRLQALREIIRVTRPAGRVAVLELSEPTQGPLASVARFHMRVLVPAIGALISRATEYRYLQTSITAFPAPREFADLMCKAGLCDVRTTALTFGVVQLFVGTVPYSQPST